MNNIKDNQYMSAIFLYPNGTLVKEGDIIKNPKLADTLEMLNKKEHVFYHNDGEIGIDLIQELADGNVIYWIY